MSDPAQGTVVPDRLPDSAAPAIAGGPFGMPDGAEVVRGQRWRQYVLQEPMRNHGFVAQHLESGERVVVHAARVDESTPTRRAAWDHLCALNDPALLRCVEALEEDGWRYEITAAPSPLTLREWIVAHQSTPDELERVVRQIGPALAALHARGVVHLGISPDSIYIAETDGIADFMLGGLKHATLSTQPSLLRRDVDPFYAPPEAAGLGEHSPGPRLQAWDWWSLGRVLQELLIGRHVLGLLLDRDVSHVTPELREKAEALLLEREPAGVRAGGVEHMLGDENSLLLLRGLLAASCDARWNWESLQRWLKREPVREYYDLPRHARLWQLRGRALTLADAAEHFTQVANWREGETLLLPTDRLDTLGTFLSANPVHQPEWERLQTILKATEGRGWQTVSPAARHTVATAIGWLALANSSGTRGTFRIWGQTIDVPGLTELLRNPGGQEGVGVFSALILPAVIEAIEAFDSAAARVLKSFAAKTGGAIRMVLEQGWVQQDDHQEYARLLLLSLERSVALQDRHTLLQGGFATSKHPELARILAEKSPSPAELVVSAFTGEYPDRFGYITHGEWRRQRLEELHREQTQITVALLRLRLARVLSFARLWGAPWQTFVGVSVGLGVIAGWLAWSVEAAAAVMVALLLGRVWLVTRVRTTFGVLRDSAFRWRWKDGFARARADADALRAESRTAEADFAARLVVVRATMAQQHPLHVHGSANPQWWDLVAGFVLSGGIAVAVFSHGALAAMNRFETGNVPAASVARHDPAQTLVAIEEQTGIAAPEMARNPEALLATGKYEVVDDGFGRRLRGPLRKWTYFAPPEVPAAAVVAHVTASSEQEAFAVVNARLLLKPFLRNSVTGLLAIRVPTTRGFGVMIFNTRDRVLVDHDVLMLADPVKWPEGTWCQIDHRRVLLLGSRLPLDHEISLEPW